MKLGENVSQLARDLGVHRTCLYQWKRKLGRGPYHHGRTVEADWRDARIAELETKVTRLEGIIGGQWQELDFSRVPCETAQVHLYMSADMSSNI